MDKYFIEVNSITYQYPYGIDKKVTDYGVLNKYIGKEFSRKEIDKIIAKMILKHPYIDNSMNLKLSIMRKTAKVDSFYHILNFRNYVGLDNIVASLWLGSDNNWYFTERLFKNEIINLSKVYKLSYDCNFDDVIKSFMNYCLHWIDDIAGWTHNLRISLKSATEDDDLAIYE